jgi:hypothetical protein
MYIIEASPQALVGTHLQLVVNVSPRHDHANAVSRGTANRPGRRLGLRQPYPARADVHFRRLFSVIREYLDALDAGRFNYRPGFHCGMCDFATSHCRD